MKQFVYSIRDPHGIHARPAGLLARAAGAHPDTVITVSRGDTSARATQLMRLMSMGIRQGDEITVSAEGANEDAAIAAMEEFFRKNL